MWLPHLYIYSNIYRYTSPSISTSIACPSSRQDSSLARPTSTFYKRGFQLSLSLAMSCLYLLDSNTIKIFDYRCVWFNHVQFNRSWSISLYTTPSWRSWIRRLSTTDPDFSGSDWLCGAQIDVCAVCACFILPKGAFGYSTTIHV